MEEEETGGPAIPVPPPDASWDALPSPPPENGSMGPLANVRELVLRPFYERERKKRSIMKLLTLQRHRMSDGTVHMRQYI